MRARKTCDYALTMSKLLAQLRLKVSDKTTLLPDSQQAMTAATRIRANGMNLKCLPTGVD